MQNFRFIFHINKPLFTWWWPALYCIVRTICKICDIYLCTAAQKENQLLQIFKFIGATVSGFRFMKIKNNIM